MNKIINKISGYLQTRDLDTTRVKDDHAISLHDTNKLLLHGTIDEKDDICEQLFELKAKKICNATQVRQKECTKRRFPSTALLIYGRTMGPLS